MKRIITLLLALALAFSLAGCGGGGSNPAEGSSDTATPADNATGISEETPVPASAGRTLYNTGLQMVCDGDTAGGIETIKEAIAETEADDWTSEDILTAWNRIAQVYYLLGDTAGEAQVKAEYTAATGEELFLSSASDDCYFELDSWTSYFEAPLVTDDNYGVVVYEDGNAMSLAEYRDITNQRGEYDLTAGENEEISFCGVTYGMTKEEFYDTLHMTPWARFVCNQAIFVCFKFTVDSSTEEYLEDGVSVRVSNDMDGRNIMNFLFYEFAWINGAERTTNCGEIFMEFENGTLMNGADGMIFRGN